MLSNRIIHGIVTIGVSAALLATGAASAFGQGRGSVSGHVFDDKGKLIVGSMVTLTAESGGQPVLVLSDAHGQWSVEGLPAGKWTVEAVKSNMGAKTKAPVDVATGATVDTGELHLLVVPSKAALAAPAKAVAGGRGGVVKDAPPDPAALKAAKRAEYDAKFKAADDALNIGKFDEAMAGVMAVSADVVNCGVCFSKVGDVYMAKALVGTDDDKEANRATGEKYYKQAIEIEPANAAPYAALANLYNQLHRLDEASQMSAKANELAAAGGAAGDADSLYNQGVILWNQQKAPEAQAALEKAVAANPKMADAQYLLGMVLINQGKMAEAKKPLTEYVKLDPKGKHADEVKALLDAIK